jgi:hypothetical protein
LLAERESAFMTDTGIQRGEFDIGRVIQRTFTAISANWLVFLVSALLLIGVPNVISGLGQTELATAGIFGPGFLFRFVGGLLAFVGAIVLQGTVVFAAVNELNGKKIELSEAFSAGVRTFFPLLGLSILMALGLVLGFVLLIVPGVILGVMWIVAAPAVVVERRGVMESFQRSRDLTRGHRWKIFALGLVYVLAASIIGAALGGAGAAATSGLTTGGLSFVNLVVVPIVNVVSSVFSAAGVAAIYYELRSTKEGVGPEQIASVFD